MTERETDFLIYPIEIRHGIVAQVRVPVDLTKAEAAKISRVVLALGDGEEKQVAEDTKGSSSNG